jgi:hypothetical protein
MGTPLVGTWPQILNRWLNINGLVEIHRTAGYLVIPSGQIEVGQFPTQAISDVVAQFDFELPANTSLDWLEQSLQVWLRKFQDILCVTIRNTGTNDLKGFNSIRRFKLTQPSYEQLEADSYSGQVMFSKFSLEFWSLPGRNYSSAISWLSQTVTTGLLNNMDNRYAVNTLVSNTPTQIVDFDVVNAAGPGVYVLPMIFPASGETSYDSNNTFVSTNN